MDNTIVILMAASALLWITLANHKVRGYYIMGNGLLILMGFAFALVENNAVGYVGALVFMLVGLIRIIQEIPNVGG